MIIFAIRSLLATPLPGSALSPPPPGAPSSPPLLNLLFFLQDDTGYNDFLTSTDYAGVYSDANALWRQRGILVDRTYADMVCAPSRASFIAGRPSHLVQPKVFSRSQEVYTSAGSTGVSSSGSTAQAVAGMILGDADAKAQLHWLPELHGRQVALRRASGSPANLARLQPLLRAHEPDGSHTLLFIAMSDIID